MSTIGENIKRLREGKKLSIRALAKKVNISHNTLASYEREKIMPSLENSFKLAKFFNVPVEYLVIGEKLISKFNDAELLVLFKKIDDMEEEDSDMVKKYILKLIKNKEERKKLKKETE